MTLDTHREFVESTANRLHSFEVTILTITLNKNIITAFYAVSGWIENH
jgi:hypothetical protein